ncbi:mRNA binding post-transcriptional regulator [Pelomyxa schiedti]|nr:mRNA binding post-transcriptional regulator [Pelomyxa schiedti]
MADRDNDYGLFVGDLAGDVNDITLLTLFSSRYASTKSAKVIYDQHTGQSRGYGFVRFSDERERTRALSEMTGVHCGSRAIRVSTITKKATATENVASPLQHVQLLHSLSLAHQAMMHPLVLANVSLATRAMYPSEYYAQQQQQQQQQPQAQPQPSQQPQQQQPQQLAYSSVNTSQSTNPAPSETHAEQDLTYFDDTCINTSNAEFIAKTRFIPFATPFLWRSPVRPPFDGPDATLTQS